MVHITIGFIRISIINHRYVALKGLRGPLRSYFLMIIDGSPNKYFVAVSQHVVDIITLKKLLATVWVHYDNYQYVCG